MAAHGTYDLRQFTSITFDGVSDVAPAINSALESLYGDGGGVLLLPGSASYGMLGEPIVLQNRTGLCGIGHRASRMYLANGVNANIITNYVSPDGVEGNAFSCSVRDLFLHGNAANQSAGTLDNANGNTYNRDGIYFTSYPVATQGSGDDYFDSQHVVERVWIYRVAGNGFTAHSRSDMKLLHVTATECEGYGFVPSYDTFLTSCVAGGCFLGGFWFKDRSSIQGTNLKAFYSGHNADSPGGAYGFLFENSAGVKLVSCEAQDNCGAGFGFVNTEGGSVLVGCVADSNNKDDDESRPAIDMWNSHDNQIEVTCYDRGANSGNQLNALRIRNGSSGNTIRIKHFTTNSGTVDRAVSSDSTATYGNEITVNNEAGTQNLGTAGASLTPNPYDGGTIVFGLTQNLTVSKPDADNGHSGSRMRLIMYQDGTGGRTVTFGAGFQLNGGTFTAATAAWAMSVIEFFYDDGDDTWYEVSRSVA